MRLNRTHAHNNCTGKMLREKMSIFLPKHELTLMHNRIILPAGHKKIFSIHNVSGFNEPRAG
jgi:hypothetical protein